MSNFTCDGPYAIVQKLSLWASCPFGGETRSHTEQQAKGNTPPACFACPNRRACLQARKIEKKIDFAHEHEVCHMLCLTFDPVTSRILLMH